MVLRGRKPKLMLCMKQGAVYDTLVSKEKLFIMFCVFRSRPVVGTSFMLARLLSIAQAPHGPICDGGLVTMISSALFQRE